MGKKCDLCGRGSMRGASRSHSKIRTLKRQNINLQSKMIDGEKVKLCTSCIRTIDKPKRVKAKRKPAASKPLKPVKKAKKAKPAKK